MSFITTITTKQRAEEACQEFLKDDNYLSSQSTNTLKRIYNSTIVEAIRQKNAQKKQIMETIASLADKEINFRITKGQIDQRIYKFSNKSNSPQRQYRHKRQQQPSSPFFKDWSFIFRAIKEMVGSQQQSRFQSLPSQSQLSLQQDTTTSVKEKSNKNNTNNCNKLKKN